MIATQPSSMTCPTIVAHFDEVDYQLPTVDTVDKKRRVRFADAVNVSPRVIVEQEESSWYSAAELASLRMELLGDLNHYKTAIAFNVTPCEGTYCVRGVEQHLCKDAVSERRRKIRSVIQGTLATHDHLKLYGITDPTILKTFYSCSNSWAQDDAQVRGSGDAADAIRIYLEFDDAPVEEEFSEEPPAKRRRSL